MKIYQVFFANPLLILDLFCYTYHDGFRMYLRWPPGIFHIPQEALYTCRSCSHCLGQSVSNFAVSTLAQTARELGHALLVVAAISIWTQFGLVVRTKIAQAGVSINGIH